MIYVSTSCVKAKTIKESMETLVSHGFRNIELSGGTQYYSGLEEDLIQLQNKYDLNLLCHNYFPPPKRDFVLNLASLNPDIYQQSVHHIKALIELSARLNAPKLAFHAGFFLNVEVSELGKVISQDKIQDKARSLQNFYDAYQELQTCAKQFGVTLYIENNVYSLKNAERYNFQEIFMLTSYQDFLDLKQKLNCLPLIDLAHLKVSSNVLKKDFHAQASQFLQETDYIHVSENNGLEDQNLGLDPHSDVALALETVELKNKIITLEVYESMDKLEQSYSFLEGLTNA